MSSSRTFCAFAAFLLLNAALGSAHDMWIEPSSFNPPAGSRVSAELLIGHADESERLPRREERIVRFESVGSSGSSPVLGLDQKRPAGLLRPEVPGLYALVYESNNAFSELPAAAFTSYLEEEGLQQIIEQRRRDGSDNHPGKELYARSLKSLLVVGEPAEVVDRATGLPLELVIETPDFHLAGDRPLSLRLLHRGEPLAAALVEVRRFGDGDPVFSGRSDRHGRVEAELGNGRWIASTVHMMPSASDRADWQSVFSTLTFEILARPAGSAP